MDIKNVTSVLGMIIKLKSACRYEKEVLSVLKKYRKEDGSVKKINVYLMLRYLPQHYHKKRILR